MKNKKIKKIFARTLAIAVSAAILFSENPVLALANDYVDNRISISEISGGNSSVNNSVVSENESESESEKSGNNTSEKTDNENSDKAGSGVSAEAGSGDSDVAGNEGADEAGSENADNENADNSDSESSDSEENEDLEETETQEDAEAADSEEEEAVSDEEDLFEDSYSEESGEAFYTGGMLTDEHSIPYEQIKDRIFRRAAHNNPGENVEDEDGYSEEALYSYSGHSTWDRYSSNYIYNKLSEADKAVWDDLNSLCIQIIESSGDEGDYYAGYGYYTDFVLGGTNLEHLKNLAYMFRYNHPQFYFLRNGILYSDYDDGGITKYCIAFGIYTEFQKGSKR